MAVRRILSVLAFFLAHDFLWQIGALRSMAFAVSSELRVKWVVVYDTELYERFESVGALDRGRQRSPHAVQTALFPNVRVCNGCVLLCGLTASCDLHPCAQIGRISYCSMSMNLTPAMIIFAQRHRFFVSLRPIDSDVSAAALGRDSA